MRKLSVFLGVVFLTIGSAVSAHEVDSTALVQKSSWGDAKEIVDYIPVIALDARFGYSHDFAESTGRFGGNGLFLDINGQISPNLYYSLNHRLASFEGEDGLGFDNTNWLTLTYENDYFYITAGKEDVKVGSFEYEAYDLDSYREMNSMFWNNSNGVWQWGISGGWYPAEGQTILAQVCNSPFSQITTFNLFAYALGWRGEWDCYESYWTANLWQYDSGRYIKALNLGNRFYLGDFTIDLDLMGRFGEYEEMFTGYTATLSPSYAISDWGRVFVKAGVETGDNIFGGAGFEYFPLKEYKDIRFHAAWAYNDYMYGHTLNIGVTWKMNFTKAAKRLFHISDK